MFNLLAWQAMSGNQFSSWNQRNFFFFPQSNYFCSWKEQGLLCSFRFCFLGFGIYCHCFSFKELVNPMAYPGWPVWRLWLQDGLRALLLSRKWREGQKLQVGLAFLCTPIPPSSDTLKANLGMWAGWKEVSEPGSLPRNITGCKHFLNHKIEHSFRSRYENRKLIVGTWMMKAFIFDSSSVGLRPSKDLSRNFWLNDRKCFQSASLASISLTLKVSLVKMKWPQLTTDASLLVSLFPGRKLVC